MILIECEPDTPEDVINSIVRRDVPADALAEANAPGNQLTLLVSYLQANSARGTHVSSAAWLGADGPPAAVYVERPASSSEPRAVSLATKIAQMEEAAAFEGRPSVRGETQYDWSPT
jgi:hypothetical protein